MSIMCNDAILERHWEEMKEIGGFEMAPNAGTTLRKIMLLDLMPKIDKYETVSVSAMKERTILQSLLSMQSDWEEICFKKDDQTISNFDEVLITVDDHVTKTISMRGSVFVKPYKREVENWYETLQRVGKTVEMWKGLQEQWQFLSSIFILDDIPKYIPEVERLFKEVKGKYCSLLGDESSALVTAGSNKTYQQIELCVELVEQVNKGLALYLEAKREEFPRLFFLSDKEILAGNLNKCFEGLDKFKFGGDGRSEGILSKENEYLPFSKPLNPRAIRDVEIEMFQAVKHQMRNCLEDYSTREYFEWCKKWIAQVVVVAKEISFASLEPEAALSLIKHQLDMHLNSGGAASNLIKSKQELLILTLCHCKSVAETLQATQPSDFKRQMQLRYAWSENDCYIEMLNTRIKYGYEYLGSCDRLVVTPLTERYQRVLLTAFNSGYYGALVGPVGTGKVETAKDLSRVLAKQFVLFNCSSNPDQRVITRFLKGVAGSNACVCFKNFDKIKPEVLSIASQEMLRMVQARRGNLVVTINRNSPIIPTSIPDNVKAMFRIAATTLPDYKRIVEVFLFSYGYHNASSLATKTTTAFQLTSELMLAEYFDQMQAIKTCLHFSKQNKVALPDEPELNLVGDAVMRVVPDQAKPIIVDLFPSSSIAKQNRGGLKQAITSKLVDNKLQHPKLFLNKAIEIYCNIEMQRPVVIVGDAFTGKTTITKTLADVVMEKVTCQFINPKAITDSQLYGRTERGWRDGVLTKILRDDDASDRRWIVFDGPIESAWVENVTTVLDGNRKLCLASGEVVTVAPNVSVIFVAESIGAASPLMVSCELED